MFKTIADTLLSLSDQTITQLLEEGKVSEGWGTNHVIDVDGTKIFAKKIPVTQLELEHWNGFDNPYNLPNFYNFGFISAGLGAFRELHAHIKTTQRMRAGHPKTAPLLYHHRLIPCTGPKKILDEQEHRAAVTSWNSDQNIDTFLRARHDAPTELVLFLEWFPHCLGYSDWFSTHTHRVWDIAAQGFKALAELRKSDLLQFDGNFHNVITDGEKFFMCDFGLVLPKAACQREGELAFYEANQFYPEAAFLSAFCWQLAFLYNQLDKTRQSKLNKTFSISNPQDEFRTRLELLDQIENVSVQFFDLDPNYLEFLLTYRPPMQIASQFIYDMFDNNAKDTPFPANQFVGALEASGWTR